MLHLIRPDTLYFGTLHFTYIAGICVHVFLERTAMSIQVLSFKTPFRYNKAKNTEYLRYIWLQKYRHRTLVYEKIFTKKVIV